MNTVETLLIIGGLGVAAFVVYKMFIDPNRFHNLSEGMKEYEKSDPKAYNKLKEMGVDLHKLEHTLDPRTATGGGTHTETSKAMMGRFMSYF